MEFIRSALTKLQQLEAAVDELARTLHKEPQFLLYFASTAYNFEQLTEKFSEKYPHAQIVGVTTTGEIGPKGFDEFSLTAQSYSNDFGKIEAVLMEDIVKYPMFDRQKLIHAAKKTGIQLNAKAIDKEGFAFVFPVGLQAGEEKMLSVVNSIFQTDGFPIIGGTAGDDAKFEVTYVSVNGRITSTGGATIFIKPNVDFYIQQENIFKSTGKKVKITKADAEKRIVYEMDHRPAAEVYAKVIGVRQNKLEEHWSLYPLARKFNNEFYNASPFQVVANGATEFYCQVYEGTILEVLEPRDAVAEIERTVQDFTAHFTELHGVVAFNCILRKLQFQHERIFPKLNEQLAHLPNLCGFSSYGEQLNKSQLNQTMLLIGFGKLRVE